MRFTDENPIDPRIDGISNQIAKPYSAAAPFVTGFLFTETVDKTDGDGCSAVILTGRTIVPVILPIRRGDGNLIEC